MMICVMDVPLFGVLVRCGRGIHVLRFHSTMYSVVLLGFVMCLGCLDGQVCMIQTTGEWWVRVDAL